MTQRTRSAPSASTAIAAHSANRCRRRDRAPRRENRSSRRSRAGRARRPLVGLVALGERPPRPVAQRQPLAACVHAASVTPASNCGIWRERAVGVQRERGAVEHQFVLAADLVDVDQRQAASRPRARPRPSCARRPCRAVGRAVRHDQDFGAGLVQALDAPRLEPDVLADRHADADAANRIGPGSGPARTRASRRTRRSSAGRP